MHEGCWIRRRGQTSEHGYKANASALQAHKNEHLTEGNVSCISSRISPLFKKPVSVVRPRLNPGLQPNNQVTYICAEQVVGFKLFMSP